MLTEIILGFGKPFISAGERTEKVSIETIVSPLNEFGKPIYDKARTVISNITDLPKLKTRSTFLNGKMGNDHIPHKKSTILSITLNPSDYKTVRLHEIEQVDWFEISNNEHFQKLRQMNVLVVEGKNTGNKLFLIPSTVIANYYLGHTLLIEAAIRQIPTQVDGLYHPNFSFLHTPSKYIHLKDRIPFKLAPHIVRYKVDACAEKAFLAIHSKSLLGDQPSFYMNPPIDEKVTWKLDCVESRNGVVWVNQIISCTSSFPFTKLVIGADKVKYTGQGKKTHERKKRSLKILDNYKNNFKAGENSNSIFETIEIEGEDIKNEYPGLRDIKFSKIKNIILKDKNKKITVIKNNREIAVFLGTGPNHLDDLNNIIPTEISNIEDLETSDDSEYEADDEKIEPDIRLVKFHELMENLGKEYSIDTLQLDQTTPQTPPLDQNVLPYLDLLIDIPWCREYKLTHKETEKREFEWDQIARRFIIKKIFISNIHVYVIEFIYWSLIDTSATLVITSSSVLSEEILLREIIKYSRKRSRWANSSPEKSYRTYRIFHNDLENYVKKHSIKIVKYAEQHTKKTSELDE